MKDVVIEKDVSILELPLCCFWIEDENGDRVSFDIIESKKKNHSVYIDNDADKIVEADNYKECGIRIPTDKLEIGREYLIRYSEELEYSSSDERLFTYSRRTDSSVLAVSFPDPNDTEKMRAYFQDRESRLEWYDIEFRDKQSCSLKLIDRSREYIYLAFAYLWDIKDHFDDYASAADVFTWWI